VSDEGEQASGMSMGIIILSFARPALATLGGREFVFGAAHSLGLD